MEHWLYKVHYQLIVVVCVVCLSLVDWVLNVVLTYNLRVNYHKVFTEQGTFFGIPCCWKVCKISQAGIKTISFSDYFANGKINEIEIDTLPYYYTTYYENKVRIEWILQKKCPFEIVYIHTYKIPIHIVLIQSYFCCCCVPQGEEHFKFNSVE